MKVEIDIGAGPCFGVLKATEMAEGFLSHNKSLLCIGDLIHNEEEMKRLNKLGLKTSTLQSAIDNKHQKVLFRAHGETPKSYLLAKNNNVQIIDATCPIVAKLQKQIANTYQKIKTKKEQILIYGNKRHPEIISLQGFCNGEAHIIESITDLNRIDFTIPIHLFSQTTKYRSYYLLIKEEIIKKQHNIAGKKSLSFHNSSCKIVAQRDLQLQDFIRNKDLIIFVSGKKSSNGKQLFDLCQKSSIPSYFISNIQEISLLWFKQKTNIGISGATSTPLWLLKKIKAYIETING